MVGNDDGFVASLVGCRHHFLHTLVNSLHGLFDGFVDTRVAHHVAVGEVDHDEVVLVFLDGGYQFVLYFVSRHFGLQVVGGHLGGSHEDALFAFIGRFASAVEEEGNVGILLRFGRVELLESPVGEVFAQRIGDIFLRVEDVNVLETGIVGSHAVILQAGDGVHACFGHVLLSEHDGEFLGAVVAVVEEDDNVAFANGAVNGCIVDGQHELVGDVGIVAFLHGLHHVGSLLALALHEQVVGFLHAFPALVAVHGIEAAHDAGNVRTVGVAYALKLFDESLSALGVSVAAVHEAVYESLVFQSVGLADFNEFEKVVERRVHAAIGGQSHEVQFLAVFLGIGIGAYDFGILEDGTVGAGTVDFYQVLVYDASGTDVEVSHFRVAHLSVGQTNVLARSQEL